LSLFLASLSGSAFARISIVIRPLPRQKYGRLPATNYLLSIVASFNCLAGRVRQQPLRANTQFKTPRGIICTHIVA
jgi:hypothetical protein